MASQSIDFVSINVILLFEEIAHPNSGVAEISATWPDQNGPVWEKSHIPRFGKSSEVTLDDNCQVYLRESVPFSGVEPKRSDAAVGTADTVDTFRRSTANFYRAMPPTG